MNVWAPGCGVCEASTIDVPCSFDFRFFFSFSLLRLRIVAFCFFFLLSHSHIPDAVYAMCVMTECAATRSLFHHSRRITHEFQPSKYLNIHVALWNSTFFVDFILCVCACECVERHSRRNAYVHWCPPPPFPIIRAPFTFADGTKAFLLSTFNRQTKYIIVIIAGVAAIVAITVLRRLSMPKYVSIIIRNFDGRRTQFKIARQTIQISIENF